MNSKRTDENFFEVDGIVLGRTWSRAGAHFVSLFAKTYEVEEWNDYEEGTQEFNIPYFAAGIGWFRTKTERSEFLAQFNTASRLENPFAGEGVNYLDLTSQKDEDWPLQFVRPDAYVIEEAEAELEERVAEIYKRERAAERRTADRQFVPTDANISVRDTNQGADVIVSNSKGEEFVADRYADRDYALGNDHPHRGWLFDAGYGHRFVNAGVLKNWFVKNVASLAWNEKNSNFRLTYKEREIPVTADALILREGNIGAEFLVSDGAFDGVIYKVGNGYYGSKKVFHDPEDESDYDYVTDDSVILPPFKKGLTDASYVKGGLEAGRAWFLKNVKAIVLGTDGKLRGRMADGSLTTY